MKEILGATRATILSVTVDEWGHLTEFIVLCKDGRQLLLIAADGEFFVKDIEEVKFES